MNDETWWISGTGIIAVVAIVCLTIAVAVMVGWLWLRARQKCKKLEKVMEARDKRL